MDSLCGVAVVSVVAVAVRTSVAGARTRSGGAAEGLVVLLKRRGRPEGNGAGSNAGTGTLGWVTKGSSSEKGGPRSLLEVELCDDDDGGSKWDGCISGKRVKSPVGQS